MKQNTMVIGLVILVVLIGGYVLFTNSNNDQHIVPSSAKNMNDSNSAMLQKENDTAINSNNINYFENFNGFYAEPAIEGNYPGVVMIHEWWGLNDNIRDMARELAKEGYRVLAVDLFGKLATTQNEARTQTSNLNQEKALENLKAAIDYLRSKGSEKMASLGWCFGGGQSLKLALSGEKLDATVIYYGQLVTDKTQLQKIKWPVLGIFGDKDTSIPVQTVNAFKDALAFLGIQNNINIYAGVGHAFANPSGQNYAPNETKDAWTKTVSFLAENLKSKASATKTTTEIKEFTMTSFFEMKDNKPAPQFSIKEISVNKGNRVRINVTNTKGMHDFAIDEYGIKKETPLNEEVTIEFTADKAGEFIYYCSKPGHRQNGQWGTLKVNG
ncbi:dienelactone hydrolase family protein [Candidatus Jorgensenbacteria bacterium]|nr:dienelactone hydrolase family protein [Candidatus Jorgensenbacteria bacterium]